MIAGLDEDPGDLSGLLERHDRGRSVASTLPVDETLESTHPRLAVTTVSRVAVVEAPEPMIRVGANADRDGHDDERSVDHEVLAHERVWLSVGRRSSSWCSAASAAHTLFAATNVLEFRSKVGGVLDPVCVGTLTP